MLRTRCSRWETLTPLPSPRSTSHLAAHSIYLDLKSLAVMHFSKQATGVALVHAPWLHLHPRLSPVPLIWLHAVGPTASQSSAQPSLRGAVVTYINTASKHESRRGKKNCQGSKGRILKCANPPSVCWCVFCSALNPPYSLSPPMDLVPFGSLEK